MQRLFEPTTMNRPRVIAFAGVVEAFKYGESALWGFSANHQYHFNQE